MSARDIIADELSGWLFESDDYADNILAALTAAGWTLAPPGSRVVPEGAVDAETMNRCLEIVDTEWRKHNTGSGFDSQSARVAAYTIRAALRALAEPKP